MKRTILQYFNLALLISWVVSSCLLLSSWHESYVTSNSSDLNDEQIWLNKEFNTSEDSLLQVIVDKYDKWRKDDDRYSLVIEELTSRLKVYDGSAKDLQKIIETNSSFCSGTVKGLGSQDSTLLESVIELSSIKKKLEANQKVLKTKLDGHKEQNAKHKSKLAAITKELRDVSSHIVGGGKFSFGSIPYSFYVTDLSVDEIDFHLKDPKSKKNYGSIRNLLNSKDLAGRRIEMVTNGGMYKPNRQPQGLYIEDRAVINPLDTLKPDNNLNFYLIPNGVFFIDTLDQPAVMSTDEFRKTSSEGNARFEFATQSGPMLVIDNKIHHKLTYNSNNKHIRSGVGVMNNGKVVFVISRQRTNFYDLATVFKDFFGCKNALYLDGAISLMYLKESAPEDVGGDFGPIISVSKKASPK